MQSHPKRVEALSAISFSLFSSNNVFTRYFLKFTSKNFAAVDIMVIGAVEFSSRGYEIKKIFA